MKTDMMAADVRLKLQVNGCDVVMLGTVGAVFYGSQPPDENAVQDADYLGVLAVGPPFVAFQVNDAQLEQITTALLAERARRRYERALADQAFFDHEWYPAQCVAQYIEGKCYQDKSGGQWSTLAHDEAIRVRRAGRCWRIQVMPDTSTDVALTPPQEAR